ncbi:MAG: penicillin acylase family protein [Bacilli bacterium]
MNIELKETTKSSRWKKIVLYAIVAVLLFSTGIIGAANWWAGRSLAKTSGTLQLPGLSAPVTVVRDENGVPHIKAENDNDLYMAQGYVTAQDRLFQMDLSRRQASGRLSEVIGDAMVEKDKFFRTFGLRRAAELALPGYSDEAMRMMDAYAAGVNAYTEQAIKNKSLPVEFTFLGYTPEPWTPLDSITITKFMAYDLGGHWRGQAFRSFLLSEFDEDKAYDLFPSYPEEAPYVIPKEELDLSKSFAGADLPAEWNGSNNWVISGEKSKTGTPLLADDPHLSLAAPAIWYQSHLESDEQNVSGVIFAGVPGIILGHNEHVAWGVTNVGPDVQDLYIEKRNPNNPHQFLYKGQWEDANVVKETIKVKGQADIDYDVVITRHGPVFSEFTHQTDKDLVLSLKWTAHESTQDLEALPLLNKATDWASFDEALEHFKAPASNFVYADKAGNIAYKINGNIPIRKKGNSLLPVPGWTGEYEWNGYIPHDELPTLINPEAGYVATANNKVVDDRYPYHISHTWAQPYRQMRIQEVLESKEKFSLEDMKALQMDSYNKRAEMYAPLFVEVLKAEKDDPKIGEAVRILEEWDYNDDPNAAAPLIFQTIWDEMMNVLFVDQLPETMMDLFEGSDAILDRLVKEAYDGKPGPWITEAGGLEKVLTDSLTRSVELLSERHGEKMADWKWGDEHKLLFSHPLSSVKPLDLIFNTKAPIPVAGSKVTVLAAARNKDTGIVNHGASWRFVIDAGDLTTGHHIVGPGQSGHFKSPWYDDQVEDWVSGTYHTTSLVTPQSKHTLILEP